MTRLKRFFVDCMFVVLWFLLYVALCWLFVTALILRGLLWVRDKVDKGLDLGIRKLDDIARIIDEV